MCRRASGKNKKGDTYQRYMSPGRDPQEETINEESERDPAGGLRGRGASGDQPPRLLGEAPPPQGDRPRGDARRLHSGGLLDLHPETRLHRQVPAPHREGAEYPLVRAGPPDRVHAGRFLPDPVPAPQRPRPGRHRHRAAQALRESRVRRQAREAEEARRPDRPRLPRGAHRRLPGAALGQARAADPSRRRLVRCPRPQARRRLRQRPGRRLHRPQHQHEVRRDRAGDDLPLGADQGAPDRDRAEGERSSRASRPRPTSSP